jgi:DNA-binding Lrp family transcriptional regulator
MKSNKNPYLKTQTEIIKTLLDGSKKTQNQIAKETDYEKSTISHALNDLEKKKVILREPIKIESGYTNKGIYNNKLCWLTYEVDNGEHVLDFLREILDPIIISDLQKSDKVISLLADIVQIKRYSSNGEEIPLTTDYFEVCKNMLRLSPSFFKNILTNDEFATKWTLIACSIRTPSYGIPTPEYRDVSGILNIIIPPLEHCVINDVLKGVSTSDELNMLNWLKKGLILKGNELHPLKVSI